MNKFKAFKELSKKEKKKRILSNVVLIILFIIVLISFVFYNKLHGEDSIFNKDFPNLPWIVNELYHMIPKVINTISIIVIISVIQKIISIIISKVTRKDNRGLTIAGMFNSFVYWIGTILMFLLILREWGVDTTTLLASAGVLTLVIGLGAQSLVADIVAGIFIVFDSEYEVGDIVDFNGFRGTIKEVGIRTTKIEDAGGNIKIINNSEIKQIINKTKELSIAECYLSIDYSESIQKVEALISSNLDYIASQIPLLIKGPYYKGVSDLGDSGVILYIVATCKEEDVYQVKRDLNREFKILCDNNNISLAFPQISIHKGIDELKMPTNEEIIKANKFASTYYDINLEKNDKNTTL